ncbi:nickel pincer cofactor biosynthesis protein LarB [Geoalkalibacter halelectricus]|uniref:Nickel pincer cofactor biosynthesis protein LarB n=1 Tax=Geoalkalibacter halelectricus TaxID=2847045 RepID=A0ABY5ZNT1_9BACT|nr:nickel pincer cofactor biosynthesis protein LarB [Geoalkalibacter halelectricus]MDO3377432.1 nickel pincer cofactor biosynthesis protein LarB [Geoalkalibacter halelectricus]UWZ80807.1 nickel pincer cofactor biosynthesis protein LarB [Geoalkalibacter halelectricus]
MNANELKDLLIALEQGRTSVDATFERLRRLPFEDIGVAMIDHHRELRQGAPEVIFGEGKSLAQLQAIVARMHERGSNILATRLDADKGRALLAAFPAGEFDADGRTFTLVQKSIPQSGRGTILVVAAGTSDLPVAREAAVTARLLGHPVEELVDVGVAGLHRLFARAEVLRRAAVVIVVAGMEGALPSVVGGLVAAPVIAVPTSVGYGAAFGGVAALLGMLNSCAGGVTVVNIDNGFGAAYAAHRINQGASP